MRSFYACLLLCSLASGVAWGQGAVYAMTNALGNNQIMVYSRNSFGALTYLQTVSTQGGGSGVQLAAVDSLGSAGSLVLDEAHDLLFAVNTNSTSQNLGAGSYNSDCQQGTITSFRVASDGTLTPADQVSSGGLFPNSLTVRPAASKGSGGAPGDQLLYVLNAGGPGSCNQGPNVTGFQIDASGTMTPVTAAQDIYPGLAAGSGVNCVGAAGFAGLTGAPAPDFACGLNPPSFPRAPSQVRFTPDGSQLVVTVRGTNSIYVFPLDKSGRAGSPTITQTSSTLPTFAGFTFDMNQNMLVSEVFGSAQAIPALSAGAVSSFKITGIGSMSSISSDVGNMGTASCWIALEPATGQYAYVANNLSNNLSSYSIGINGKVTLLNANAATTGVSGPNDLATAVDGGASFLYVLDSGSGTVGAYQVNLTNGSLTGIAGGSGLPVGAGAQGLAAF